MADTNYDGIFGGGFSFTFTPTTGTPFGSTQAQTEEETPAKTTIETAKFTPNSGANSGVEQFALGRYPVADYGIKVTYNAAAHAAAIACQSAKIKGTLVCTYGDGSTDTYVGAALTMVDMGNVSANNLREGNLTFTVPTGPSNFTFSAGTTITVVQTTATLVSGTLTLDMTASPYSGGVKTPIRAFFLNPASNPNTITIAKGATNGYTGFGSTFAITLSPGESCQLNALTALSGTVKTLDLTGTGTQALVVQIQFQ